MCVSAINLDSGRADSHDRWLPVQCVVRSHKRLEIATVCGINVLNCHQ